MPPFAPRVLIDWDGDGTAAPDDSVDALAPWTIDGAPGSPTDTIDGAAVLVSLEDATADVRYAPPLTITRGRDVARELSPPLAGEANCALANDDGAYSSANDASPLAGMLLPGRVAAILYEYDGDDYPRFVGRIDAPAEQPGRDRQLVALTMFDGLATLKAVKVSTAMYTGILIDAAIGHVLDAAGWPADKRVISTFATTLARWWVDGVDAFSAIRDLVQTEGGSAIFYVDENGNLVAEDRHYRYLTARSTTSQATVSSQGAEPLFNDFTYDTGQAGIINTVTVPVRSFASTGGVTIWSASGLPVALGPGEARTFPVSTTADGFSGASVVATISPGSATTGLDRTSGKTATLTVTAGAGGATVTALSVTATTWTIATVLVSNSLDTTASQDTYGPRSLRAEFVPNWIPSVNEAISWCNYVVARYGDPVPQCQFSLTNGDATSLLHALSRRISDRVTVVEPIRAFVDDDFTIEAVSDRITPGPNLTVLFDCERAGDQALWVLGVAGYSELGSTTKLAF